MASAWSQLDQLLTCAICLDRYRNPKLLPCQHTFCMEPCLEGLIDYARRQIKCPECRAEHRIPYQGVQAFPTNVTLMRFLELHRDITGEEPEPPPSMMERCNVCSEKSNLEKCAHCEKKICTDCKDAHVDILRREINRINNQVRRGLHRLSEALTQTKKNADKLQINCNQVKDEIEDIVRRYSKDLKHTEEKLKHDLETYTQTELKSVNKLKEDLEAEVSTMTSNCDLVDKYIKNDAEWTDAELLEYKDIFLKTLDFLRSFDPDNSDFSRRIKFQPRADPDVLHRNIADFGELKINAPLIATPQQQTLVPPQSNALMRSQSDHRLAAQFARRQDNRSFADINQRFGGGHTSDTERDGRPTSPLYGRSRRDTDSSYRRYGDRPRDYDYQEREIGRSRYARDENSSFTGSRWREGEDYGYRSRYSRDTDDVDSETQHTRTVRFADDTQGQTRERIFDTEHSTKGPLSGVIRLMDSPKLLERLHQNEVRQKQQQIEKDKPAEETSSPRTQVTSSAPQPPPRRTPSRQQSEDDIDRQKKANQQAVTSGSTAPSAELPPVQQTSTPTSETPHRSAVRRQTSAQREDDSKPAPTTERVQRRESRSNEVADNTASPRGDTNVEQHTEIKKQLSTSENLLETTEQDSSSSSSSSTSSSSSSSSSPSPPTTMTNEPIRNLPRCPRPALGKTSSLDGGSGASTVKIPLDNTAAHPEIAQEDEDSDNDEFEDARQLTQSSFFSRPNHYHQSQRRLPDPEPRLLEEQDDESEEEEEEEEEGININEVPDHSQDNKVKSENVVESDSETSSSSSSSESEDSDEEESEEDVEEAAAVVVGAEKSSLVSADLQRRRPSDESQNSKSSCDYGEAASKTGPSLGYLRRRSNDQEKAKAREVTNPIYESNKKKDEETEASDKGTNMSNTNDCSSMQKVPSNAAGGENFSSRSRSDDTDTNDSSSSSSSTKYHSLSRNTTPLVSNGTTTRDESVSSEGSGSSGGSTSSSSQYSSSYRQRPPITRSKSSHEIGLGIDARDLGDDDDDDDDPVPTPTYRSRADRMSEGSNSFTRTRNNHGPKGQDDSIASNLSSSSNSSWAKYLRNKYGSNATGRVVPRSRSSHALYQRSDSDTSEDDVTSGRDSILSASYGFSNPRSTYLQKKRMVLKFGSRGTDPGNFTWPRGVAIGPDNNVVIADSSNHRVQVFDSIGKFLHEFGTYGSSEGEFDCLAGVAVNRIGQYIVSDRYNQRIQLFDPSGRFLRAFGCEGRTDGRFNYPWGITTDSLGFIYVCDKENHRIQVFQSDGTFVGKFGSIGSRPGQLEHPHYIAVSNTNRVVVSDCNNHRIQIFDVNGRSLSTFGSEGSGEGQFKFPRGVAVDDQGYIIVGDSGNNRVQIFHPDGTFLRGFGTWGAGEGEFKGLEGLAVTSGGSIIVCDRENHRIQVF